MHHNIFKVYQKDFTNMTEKARYTYYNVSINVFTSIQSSLGEIDVW